MATRNDLVLVGSGFTQMDSSGIPGRTYACPTSHRALTYRLERLMGFFPHSSALFRRDVANELGGYRPNVEYGDDSDLWIRLSEVGRIGCVADPLVRIRLHGNQMSHHGGGRLQAVHACATIAAHFLRVAGEADPIAAQAPSFLPWVEQQMLSDGFFDQRRVWQEARTHALELRHRPLVALQFGSLVARSRHGAPLVWQKMFGSSLPRRLAAAWRKLTFGRGSWLGNLDSNQD